MDFDEDDDFVDEDFFAAVDQLVAQYQGKAQQLTQPESPNPRSTATRPAGPQPGAAQAQPTGHPAAPRQPPRPAQQPQQWPAQQQQHWPPAPGVQGQLQPGVHAAANPGPRMPAAPADSRPEGAGPLGSQPSAVPGPAAGAGAVSGFPVGRVSQAAAELRSQPAVAHLAAAAVASAPSELQTMLAQMQQERDRLQQQLGSVEGTNKLLRSNLDQVERDRHGLRQRLQQLEARPQPSAGVGAQASFTALEMQRQLETLKQQLMFKEQEMEELKRQQGDKLERLREAEAAVQSLQALVQAKGAVAAQQQQQQEEAQAQRSTLERGLKHGASPFATNRQRSSMRQPLAEQQQSQQPPQPPRASGHKRRQSGAAEALSAALEPPATHVAAAAPQGHALPLLGPVVLATALSPSTATEGLVSRLWAVCGQSVGALLGVATHGAAPAGMQHGAAAAATGWGSGAERPAAGLQGHGGGGAPTALLLRAQARACTGAAAPDTLSSGFRQACGQQLQQAAAGLLPAASLLDSIGAMAAAVVADKRCGSQVQGSAELAAHQAQLLSDGLSVLQHLLEQDAGCRQAAAGSVRGSGNAHGCGRVPCGVPCDSSAAGEGAARVMERLQLSHRISLSCQNGQQQQEQQQAAVPGAIGLPPCSTAAAAALPQCERILRQHSSAFAGKGHGMASILVAASGVAGQRQPQVLAAALGALCALAAGIPVGGGREALKPVLESGAMERFLRPPALRAQALQLLHLLLEEPALAQDFERSLAQAGGGGQGGETPGSHSCGGGGGSARLSDPAGDLSGGLSRERSGGKGAPLDPEGANPMQVDGSSGVRNADICWGGAPAVLRRIVQSLSLPPAAPQPAAMRPGAHPHAPQHAQHGAAPHEQAGAPGAVAAPRAAGGGAKAAAAQLCAAPRQALKLLAMLWERQAHGILSHLIQSPDDATSGGGGSGKAGEGLCQKLMQLLEAASAQQGPDAATTPLSPAQFPCPGGLADFQGPTDSTGVGAEGGPAASACAATQLEWQQRLRLAQEALTLLRGLLLDDVLGAHALEELCSPPSSARLSLATLGRLARLEPPPPLPAALPPLPLAPWAQAIGSSSAAKEGSINPGAGRGALACCSVEDVVYMARSMRRRVLHRLKAPQQ